MLQGIADRVGDPELHDIAFQILGQTPERVLPNVLFIWFAALLLTGTTGRSRIIGWVIVPAVIGLELAAGIGFVLGIEVPFLKLHLFLPLVWLLVESVKAPAGHDRALVGPTSVGNRTTVDGAERLTIAIYGETPASGVANKDRGPDRATALRARATFGGTALRARATFSSAMPMVGITWVGWRRHAIKHQGSVAPGTGASRCRALVPLASDQRAGVGGMNPIVRRMFAYRRPSPVAMANARSGARPAS